MAPVPPLTVRMSVTFRMTSLGEDQPRSLPVRCTPISLGICEFKPGHAANGVYGIGPADANGNHAKTARIDRMGVRADHHAAGESVIFLPAQSGG